jgi:hypothetical protein
MCWEGTLTELRLHPLHVILLRLNVVLLRPPDVKLVERNITYKIAAISASGCATHPLSPNDSIFMRRT